MLINYLSFENKIAALHLSVNCLDQPLLRLETFDFGFVKMASILTLNGLRKLVVVYCV